MRSVCLYLVAELKAVWLPTIANYNAICSLVGAKLSRRQSYHFVLHLHLYLLICPKGINWFTGGNALHLKTIFKGSDNDNKSFRSFYLFRQYLIKIKININIKDLKKEYTMGTFKTHK